jgi:hypothetical protein
MSHFVTIGDDGHFSLDGQRWMCNSAVYFGNYPGDMHDWLTDAYWPKNQALLDRDFGGMAQAGLNHTALFFKTQAFFHQGRVVAKGMDRLDAVVEAAKRHGLRLSIFIGEFIETPELYTMVTGLEWEHDNRWLPSFNPALHAAYVAQIAPFAERYKDESAVLAYTDRIDRYFKGFDNTSIPFNLKEEWIAWLQARYGSFANLLEAVGGADALENHPTDWDQVLLPQESRWNASLKNPLAYDYILMQKSNVGEAQARFDAEIKRIAPHQFVWTPFEGNTNTWAMLDGFTPETKKLQAIWMEYYYFENTRPSYVQNFEEWVHTREPIHRRLAHQLPVVYNAAYMMTRYLKLSVQQPVVICHGSSFNHAAYGEETITHQVAVYDRIIAACLAAGCDGFHYWQWNDDASFQTTTEHLQKMEPTANYWNGRSKGLIDWDGHPRPVLSLITQYSDELQRRAEAARPDRYSDVLLLSSAPRMYNLFRRMAYPTAAAVSGALTRLGVECDYRWTAQNDVPISEETLHRYRCIVIADNMYERDFRDMPAKLLRFVEHGGTLYFAMDRYSSFRDEHGVAYANAALTRLTGVDPHGATDWPGAHEPCRNSPAPLEQKDDLAFDILFAFPRVSWGICPAFRHLSPHPYLVQYLGFRSTDDDTFTLAPGLAPGADVIAVAKFPEGTYPLYYRHQLGKGTVYVNAWTTNLFRDSESRNDYGGWEYDWMLSMALRSARVRDIDMTSGASLWLRNVWGYFWREL